MKNVTLWLVLVVIALAGCLGAPPRAEIEARGMGQACTVDIWWGQWQSLGLTLIMISGFMLSIGYMLGSFFNSVGVIAWVKNELFQLVGTLWFFVITVGLIGGLCTLDPGIIGITTDKLNFFDASISLLENLRGMTISAWWYLLGTNLFVATWSTAGYGYGGGGIGYSTTPFAGFAPMNSFISFLMTSAVIATLTTQVQVIMMKFIQLSMMNIIFPVGIFLRCFEPTRKFGGALMGLAFGLFLFYPMLTTVTLLVVDDIGQRTFANVASNFVCKGANQAEADAQCCSRIPGACDLTTGKCAECINTPSRVDDASQCCTGQVEPDPVDSSAVICKQCYLGGAVCTGDSDCCSGTCENIDPATGAGRCKLCKISIDTTPGNLVDRAFKTFLGVIGLFDPFSNFFVSFYTNVLTLIPIIFVGAFLMPALNFVILISIVQSLSAFFGEEVDITNLTRLI
ncbi:hypothetical protein HY570_04390 [Candidatus Micrarchaeota archaeon]|nr:hypothetical protein [Candidatus Micrarchaeota archaeon]